METLTEPLSRKGRVSQHKVQVQGWVLSETLYLAQKHAPTKKKHKTSKCAQKTSSSRGINAKLSTSTRAEGFEPKAFACLVTAHLSGGPRKAVGMARFAGMNVSEL